MATRAGKLKKLPRALKTRASDIEKDVAESRLDAAYPHLVRWKAKALTPDDPQSPEEFAVAHGLTLDELKSLTLRPGYADDVFAASVDWAKTRSPEMFHSMYAAAKDSPTGAGAERFMRSLAEVIKRKSEITTQTQINVFGDMDDAKFARVVTRALKAPDGPQTHG